MTYASLFSGAEGAGKGLEAAGFKCLWQCEINQQASSVLRYRYPGIVNYGDVTKLDPDAVPVPDVLWMSPPCQDLSVAGARKGLKGERSGLFYDAVRIAGRLAERGTGFVLMEQVPGLFSSHGGDDFREVLRGFLDIGARDIAWTVLDAQWFGVPQRRKRAFFIVDFAGERAEQILFEPDSLQRNPPPSRETGQGFADVAGTLSANGGGTNRPAGNANELDFCIPEVSHTLSVGTRYDFETETLLPAVAHAAARNDHGSEDGTNRAALIAAFDPRQITSKTNRASVSADAPSPTLAQSPMHVVGFKWNAAAARSMNPSEVAPALEVTGQPAMFDGASVRRLTPVECERLMGWGDDWTRWGIDQKGNTVEMSDAARYKMCGNGVVSTCSEWIGRRVMEAMR